MNLFHRSGQWIRRFQLRTLKTHVLQLTDERAICYRQIPGSRDPSIVMIPGLHSYAHMSGMKAGCLLRFCDTRDLTGIVYDHECMGESAVKGMGQKKTILFSHWVENAVKVVMELTEEKPVVLMGSSMGGWIALLAAQILKERIRGLILLSPALNYVYPYYQSHMRKLPSDVQNRIETGDIHIVDGKYGDALLKRDFAEDSLKHHFSLEKDSIPIHCPVRIIHGLKDEEVDYKQSNLLCDALQSNDVDLIYRKNSTHELESPPDLELFLATLDRLIKDYSSH